LEPVQFLDEFRPFRRGELALARRAREDPLFLPPAELDLLRYALRLGQLSGVGSERDAFVDRIGFTRLRLLQLLAPVLPTDPDRIEPAEVMELLPRVGHLVGEARAQLIGSGAVSGEALDAEIGTKRLALVLAGAAGAGYAYLGALHRLDELGLEPSYLVGCSMGSILAVLRARARRFELPALLEEVEQLRARAVFQPPSPAARFGLPAALRLDLRRAIGDAFRAPDGRELRLCDLEIPVDVAVTGLGGGALAEPRESWARLLDADPRRVTDLAELRGGALGRAVGALIALAMSRRLLSTLAFGADPATAEIPALDAAGFSAAIPALLHYEPDPADGRTLSALHALFRKHDLVALVDGAISSSLPAQHAWQALESGRIGTRSCAIIALDALDAVGRVARPLAPLQRVIAATSQRDRPFWDLRVPFRRAPSMLDLFPRRATVQRAARDGELAFEESAQLLRTLLAPVPPWPRLCERLGLEAPG
jgi:hypothetical protein